MTEHEVRTGIIDTDCPERHGLAFIRELKGLDNDSFGDAMAVKYKETIVENGKGTFLRN